jgi:hypothetical protein
MTVTHWDWELEADEEGADPAIIVVKHIHEMFDN